MLNNTLDIVIGARGFGKSQYVEEYFYKQNIPLLKTIARRYHYPWQDLSISLVQAVKSYDAKKGSWSTYLWKACQNQIFYERRKKRFDCADLQEDLIASNTRSLDDKLVIETVKTAYKRLEPKEKEVLYHYLSGIGQEEIAKAMGYKQPYISKLLNQTITKLKGLTK